MKLILPNPEGQLEPYAGLSHPANTISNSNGRMYGSFRMIAPVGIIRAHFDAIQRLGKANQALPPFDGGAPWHASCLSRPMAAR